ncbi:MAG: hypothetical protein M3680_16055, partial [Myxococcota bacterium]|nr:hypothetical protein [Myxococcota bacterium]
AGAGSSTPAAGSARPAIVTGTGTGTDPSGSGSATRPAAKVEWKPTMLLPTDDGSGAKRR